MDNNVKKINDNLVESENTPIVETIEYYRTNKFGDWLFDTIPYGWRVYNKYCSFYTWVVSAYQRMRYGVSDAECWSLDVTFTNFILPRLKHFKKMNRYTHPGGEITPEKWEEIIDEIIWTFEYLKSDGEHINPFPVLNKEGEDLNEYFNRKKTTEEKFLMDQWFKKNEELEIRKQNGLKLFAQYYCQLWD